MLFYVKCPSCSRLISRNLGKYNKDLSSIRNDPNMSKKEKEEFASQLLIKYNYKKICCRIRILGLIPYHEIVVT
jgi:DNA-directed RNA polymerase subunit N (RpoN/RPB10)